MSWDEPAGPQSAAERERLQTEQARLAAIVASSDDAIVSKDLDGNILTWNPGAERLFGYSAAEAIGRPIAMLLPPDRPREEDEILARLRRGERVEHLETARIRKDGALVEVAITVSPLRDAAGDIVGASKIARDITELKRAEQELRRREEQAKAQAAELEAIFDCIADGIVVYDREGRTLRSTPSADRILGFSLDERRAPVQSRLGPQFELFSEDGRRFGSEDMPAVRAAVHGEAIRGEVVSLRVRGGEPRWIRINAAPLVLDGKHAGAVVSMTDITERRQATAARRESEARLRRLYESGMIGVFYFDLDGPVTDANDAFLATIGYAREDLAAGRILWEQITPPDYRAQDEAAIEELRRDGIDTPYEKEFIRKDGSRVPVLVGAALFDEAHQHGIAFVLDITSRKRAETALRQANERLRDADRRKDEFLGMLSHELRNPLAPIRSSVYLLRHAPPASAQASRARDVIERQVEHLTRIVDDLLDVTRIARGKILLHRERLDLRELVARAVDDAHVAIERRGIALRSALPPARLWVDADATRLTQALGNLLTNAAKFTPPGGEIVVALREAGSAAEINVRDTGAGIDPELLPNLFDAFVQGERTLARSEGGLGLGLALVKGLVALHGGSVQARSEGIGRGAEFVLTLPLLGPAADAPPPPSAPSPPAARRRVLVVDDNADAAESLAELVTLFGHEAEIAYDGPSALEKVRHRPPDVVLCDIGLPGMTGYEVAQAIRAEGDGGIRLIAISGYAQAEDVQRAAEAGFHAHVAKPADPDDIGRLLT